jgi:indolepyruvate ferredoxin oxidoreductase
MTRELEAEGVRQIVVVSDAPDKYHADAELAPGVQVYHRDHLDTVQKTLREVPGCTVLIYEQTCATEKRRRRKRGTESVLARRVVIHEEVCEGCGDCAVQSNCLSVEPVETELGRKRRINQSSCNQDFSCLKGFCPSLVTVEGGQLRRKQASREVPDLGGLPPLSEPHLPGCSHAYGIVVAGIGGTGVITIGQLLGVAAHIEGKGVVTQEAAGLAQKGGATWSHVQIAEHQRAIYTTKVGMAEADLVLGCDPIVTAHEATLSVMQRGRTRLALNSHGTPTAAVLHDPGWAFPSAQCDQVLNEAVGPEHLQRIDAVVLAERLLGDAIYANPLLLGFAWQMGWVPLQRASIERALTLNGTQVERNLQAFAWGRHAAHDPAGVSRWSAPTQTVQWLGRAGGGSAQQGAATLDALIQDRYTRLVDYQDRAYAQRYLDVLTQVRAAEQKLGSNRLSLAVARHLYKLMAFKDEYEVARLLTSDAFRQRITNQFEGAWTLVYHLAPPMLNTDLDDAGRPRKRAFGPAWRGVLHGLAWARRLRGTWLDPLRRSAEHLEARQVLDEYLQAIARILPRLTPANLSLACQIAELPETIKGYGPIRQPHVAAARQQWQQWLAQGFGAPPRP